MIYVPLSDEEKGQLKQYWLTMRPKEYVDVLFDDLPVPHYCCDYMVNITETQKRFELMDI